VTDTLTITLESTSSTTVAPDLLGTLREAMEAVVIDPDDYAIAFTPGMRLAIPAALPSSEDTGLSDAEVEAIMQWLADPDSLDWDHLDRIDSEGWQTD
jgi:hypothetical protein